MRSRAGRLLPAVIMAFGLVACTGGGESASTTTASTTSTTEASTTTSSSTTTAPEPSGPTQAELEAQLLAFHKEFAIDAFDRDTREPGVWDAYEQWFEDNTIDPIRSTFFDAIERDRSQGIESVGPGNVSNVTDVRWSGLSTGGRIAATIADCSLDRMRDYDANGNIIIDRATIFAVENTDYVYDPETERFYVKEFRATEQACDPTDLLADGDGTITSTADAEAVLAVHRRLYSETLGGFDMREEGYESTRRSIEEVTTSTEREILSRAIDEWETVGTVADGAGYESNVVGMRVEGDRAAVVDCSRPRLTTYNPAGEVVRAEEQSHEYMESFLIKEGGEWKVEFFWQNGGTPCTPD